MLVNRNCLRWLVVIKCNTGIGTSKLEDAFVALAGLADASHPARTSGMEGAV